MRYIYLIYSNVSDKVYVGSTTNTYPTQRKSQHVYHAGLVDAGNFKHKYGSYEIIKEGDWTFEVVEEGDDIDRSREQWWIDFLREDCNLDVTNIKNADLPKEKILEKLRDKYKKIKEEGKIPYSLNYYYQNKQKVLEKAKKKYHSKKDDEPIDACPSHQLSNNP